MSEEVRRQHGFLGAGRDWNPPSMVTCFDVEARSTFTSIKAHEYNDTPDVLREKVAVLAGLIRKSREMVAYTGAGISTAAGIDDYASKAKQQSVTAAGRKVVKDWKNAMPTSTHFALTALYDAGWLRHWLQQNHDSLPQKAGYPQHCLNEIHGSLHDPANPIVPYEGSLRDDLYAWLKEWEEKADLCLALGTSMSGFNCDSVPAAVARRYVNDRAKRGLGLVIVNLQQTPYDDQAALRIYAKTDDVFELLMREMGLAVPDEIYKPRAAKHRKIAEDIFLLPFDHDGNPLPSSKKKDFITWDLRIGKKVRLTGGPYESDVGEIVEKNASGDYKMLFENSIHPVFNIRRRTFALWMGRWWVEMATTGRGIVPGGKIPFVNIEGGLRAEKPETAKTTLRYTNMKRAGLPDEVIRHKMTADGLSLADISTFLLQE